jgi:DNA-binding transcriptional MerR regulator
LSTALEFKYRVIYESLSRFSSALSQAATLADVQLCLQRQVKYLFDCQLVRFCFYKDDQHTLYSGSTAESRFRQGGASLLCHHEHWLYDSNVPVVIHDPDLIAHSLQPDYANLAGSIDEIWGWHLRFGPNVGIIASVCSGKGRSFKTNDVPVLKIMLENLYAKLLSLRLIDELGQSKRAVEQALLHLQEKNDEITQLLSEQETVIRQRTHELEQKNARLHQLSRQHAHLIREPLCRILSLAYLIDMVPVTEATTDVIPALLTTARDLDVALQRVVSQMDAEVHPSTT